MNISKACAVAAFVCFIIYATIALQITSPRMLPTGDEPHYLITAHSLAVDGDLSLKENYLNRDYRVFYPAPLAKRTTLAPDREKELPAFGPGLSMFLTPFYWIAIHLFPKWLVPFLRLVICGVAALSLYHTLRFFSRFHQAPGTPALRVLAPVAAFAFASPLLTYCSMFYPEIVASLLLVLSLRAIDAAGESPIKSAAALALLAPALIWLHPKYLALSFLLIAISAYTLYRIRNTRLATITCFLQVAGVAAFFIFLHSEYGSWSPNRIYGGAQKEASLVDLLMREGSARLYVMLRMLFGYWIDQRFGVLVYAPAYAAFFPAAIYCVRKFGLRFAPALLMFAAHFLLISWGAQMGGYAPPSRHFVVLIAPMLLTILLAYSSWTARQKIFFWVLATVGWAVGVMILTHYRLIFTNATWRNPEGYSEFWSYWNLQHHIPRLTSTPPDILLALVWVAAAAACGFLLRARIADVERTAALQ